MTEPDDIELLRQYAGENSEAAFAAIVGRHVNLVYSVALRRVENPHAAEEITQAVFIILARKAKSFSRKTILTGWLHQTTRLTAANYLRTEIRRQRREQEAFMQSTLSETETWTQIAPLLDDAIAKLGERERNAILLRYFENKSAGEMAAALRIDPSAAQKRVTRAVEKLRAFFAKRGVTLTAAAIAGAVAANSVQAAPAGLAATVTAVTAKGAAVSASTLTLIKGALKIMAWTKMKMAIVAGAAILLAAGTTATFWHFHFGKDSWQNRFDAVYKLKDGEAVRFIAPPYIPERLEYYHTEKTLQDQAKAIPRGPDLFIFKQDKNGQLQYAECGFGFKQHSLQQILGDPFGFLQNEFEVPKELLNLNLPGDWTIREGVNREALLTALEPIVFKATGRNIHFEKRTVERDVIVAHGLAKNPGWQTKVKIYADKPNGRGGGTGFGNLQKLLGMVGEKLNVNVVNEAQADQLTGDQFDWADYPDANFSKMGDRREELTDKVLKNLTTQIGITFTHEQRPVDIWFVTEQP